MYSLLSANGPSVISTSPAWTRTTDLVERGSSPPPKIQTPCFTISSFSDSTAPGAATGAVSPSTSCTASR